MTARGVAPPLIGFKSEKAAQIAAYFAQRAGAAIEKLKLIKLIYLSEREHLRRHGQPMLYDELFSLEHGPICSSTLNGINGHIDQTVWSAFLIKKDNKMISAKREFGRDDFDELSDAEIDVLEAVWNQFGRMTASEIRKYTHDHCPEYTEVQKGRVPISYKKLLDAVGRPDAELASDLIDAYRRTWALLSM